MRIKLATVVLGVYLCGLISGMALIVAKEQWQIIQYRLDRIEQFLSQGAAVQVQPQSHRESHKGEISKPRDMKV